MSVRLYCFIVLSKLFPPPPLVTPNRSHGVLAVDPGNLFLPLVFAVFLLPD